MNDTSSQRPDSADALADIARRIQAISQENRRLFRQLMDSEHRFRGLARSVWQVQEEERRRLARELHDSIGQTLVGLIHQVERLTARIGEREARSLADDVHAIARNALEETRELSRLLRPPVLDDLGLEAAIAWLVRTLGERTGLETRFDTDLGGRRLPRELETLVFRVVQEALNNVVKHAPGATAVVRMEGGDDMLDVTITDDGPGFDRSAETRGDQARDGSGLRGIRDRVELFGGECHIDSAPGRGTQLAIRLRLDSGKNGRPDE